MKMAAACVVDHPCVSECPTSRPGTAVSSAIHDVIQEAVLAACRPPTSSRLIAQSSDDILEEQRPTTASVVDDVLYSILDAAARPTTSSSHRPSTSTIHTVRLHHHPHNAPRSLAHPGDITLALASCDEDVSQHASNGQPQGNAAPANNTSWLGFPGQHHGHNHGHHPDIHLPGATPWPGVAPSVLEKLAAVRRRSDAEPLESPPLGDGVMDCSVGGVGMINLQRGECTLAAAARGADSMGGVSMGGETMGRGAPGMDASAHSNAETTTPAVLPDIHATLLNNNNNNNNNEKTPPPAAPDITPLSSTHPLLADAHATLERQLQQQYTTLQQQLHEARGALTRAKRHREQQGVLLHQHQQALTRVQGRVDSLTTECAGVVQARVDKEAQVEVLRGEEMVEANKCARDMQQVAQLQSQAHRIAAAVVYLQQQADEASSQVAVTKRATYAADEAAKHLHHKKQRQDILLLSLAARKDTLTQQLEVAMKQAKEHVAATEDARAQLVEVQGQVDRACKDKQRLVRVWTSMLKTLQQRDKMLLAATEATAAEQQQQQELQRQLNVLHTQLQKQQQEVESVNALVKRLTTEVNHAEEAVQQQQKQLEAILDSQQSTRTATAYCDKEADTLERRVAELQRAQRARAEQYARLAHEKQLLHVMDQRLRHQRSARQLLQQLRNARNAVQQQESVVQGLESDIQAVVVQCAQEEQRAATVQSLLTTAHAAVAAAAARMSDQEQALAAAKIDVANKTRALDAGNKRLLQLKAGMVEEDASPWAASLRNMRRALETQATENAALLRAWVKQQQQLVAQQAQHDEVRTTLEQQRDAHRVLQHKQQRLGARADWCAQQATHLHHIIKTLHSLTSRLGTTLADTTTRIHAAHDAAITLHTTAAGQMQEVERATKAVENALQQAQEECMELRVVHGRAVEGEDGAQRTWEELCALQEAVQSGEEQQPVTNAQQQVFVLKQRLAGVRAQQQQLVKEVQVAVEQRDVLLVQGHANQQQREQRKQEAVQAKQRRAVAVLQRTLDDKRSVLQAMRRELEVVSGGNEQAQRQLQQLRSDITQLQQDTQRLQYAIDEIHTQRRKALLVTCVAQKMAQLYQQAIQGTLQCGVAPSRVEVEYAAVTTRQQTLVTTLDTLYRMFPDLGHVVDNLRSHLDAVHAVWEAVHKTTNTSV